MGSIIGLIVPILLKGLELYLNSVGASIAIKKRFFEFAEQMSGEYLNSVKLRDSYKDQLKALEEKDG